MIALKGQHTQHSSHTSQKFSNEIMVEISPKSIGRDIGELLLMKFS